jgi:hypothetical protein
MSCGDKWRVETQTLERSDECCQERRTPYRSPPRTPKLVQWVLEECMPLEQYHWDKMQSAVDWEGPFEYCEKARQRYVCA